MHVQQLYQTDIIPSTYNMLYHTRLPSVYQDKKKLEYCPAHLWLRNALEEPVLIYLDSTHTNSVDARMTIDLKWI